MSQGFDLFFTGSYVDVVEKAFAVVGAADEFWKIGIVYFQAVTDYATRVGIDRFIVNYCSARRLRVSLMAAFAPLMVDWDQLVE